MSAKRIQQALLLIVLALAIGVMVFHAFSKPSPEPAMVSNVSSYMRSSSQWLEKYPPDFRLKLSDEETFHLAEHIGRKIIILNFFATWCGPCKEEMPELQAYVDKHKEDPIILVGIDADEKADEVHALWKDLRLSFPVGIDTNKFIGEQYGVNSYPTTVFIGIDGRISLYQIGGIANADVVFDPLLMGQLELLKRNLGISRSDYEEALKAQVSPATIRRPSKMKHESDVKLEGLRRDFAEKMRCPSCRKSLYTCNCDLCDSVKERLNTLNVTNKTDEQVLTELFMEGPES
jgi:thiol-disulfide isomerase/thioredoxin